MSGPGQVWRIIRGGLRSVNSVAHKLQMDRDRVKDAVARLQAAGHVTTDARGFLYAVGNGPDHKGPDSDPLAKALGYRAPRPRKGRLISSRFPDEPSQGI